MNIQEIIKKLLAGTALTDDEKSFAEGFDLQALTDKASASARRKAEGESATKLKRIEELEQELEAMKSKGATSDDDLAKLRKEVEKLTKAKAESDAKVAAQVRKEAIAAAAKENGITMAEGVSAKAFEQLLNLAVGDTKLDDADGIKAAMEAFKRDNPAMIADAGHAGVGGKGSPSGGGASSFIGNPFKKGAENLTEQMRLMRENPAEAKRLAAAEGINLETGAQ